MANLDTAFLDHSQNFQTPKSTDTPIKFSKNSAANRLYQHIKSNPKYFNISNESILFRSGKK